MLHVALSLRIMKVIVTYDYLICGPSVARNLQKKIPNNFCKYTLVIPVHALEMYVNPCKSEFGGYFNV